MLPIQRVWCVAVVTAFVWGSDARAQSPIDADGYVAVVLRAHPAARQSAGLVELGQAERSAVGRWPDPVLDVSLARARPGEPAFAAGAESGFGITQAIPWPGARSASIRAGDRGVEAFAASAEGIRWDLVADARWAFARLALSRSLVAILRTAEEDTRSLRDLVARRADLGESRESDRLKTTVEWLRQRRILADAERDARSRGGHRPRAGGRATSAASGHSRRAVSGDHPAESRSTGGPARPASSALACGTGGG